MKHQSGRPCIRISLTFFLSFPTITCNTRTKLLSLEFFDFRYRRNLKAFYIVHPTVWAKIVTWFFTTFTASSIKEKVHFLSGIQYLYDWIDPDQLEIPAFVLEYDMKVSTVFQVIKFSYATLSLSACERRCLFRLLFHALSNESRKRRLLRKRPNFSCMHPNRSQICSRLDKIYPSDGEIVFILIFLFCFVSFQFSVWFFKNNIVTLFFSGKVSRKIAA